MPLARGRNDASAKSDSGQTRSSHKPKQLPDYHGRSEAWA